MNGPLSTDERALFINSTVNSVYKIIDSIPGSHLALNYTKTAYQNDPFRIVLELFLVFFALKYMLSKKYKPHDNAVKLTEKEVNELVEEWQPEPLVPKLSGHDEAILSSTPVIESVSGGKCIIGGTEYFNLATTNCLNLNANGEISEKAIDTLKNYGVGTCGPPGFYGTLDIHMELEKKIAKFLGAKQAIMYSQDLMTMPSVIPAFAKRGDLLVVDRGANFAIQRGVQISRSNVRWFRHNDMDDLEHVLEDIRIDDITQSKRITRRFIITEGLSDHYGDVVPLDRLIELKKKYKYRLILDESLSIGVLGKRGAGVIDLYNAEPSDVDMIVGTFTNALAASGGFCAGNEEIVDHQRLSGSAYCFSASMPAMLATAALEAIDHLSKNPSLLTAIQSRMAVFRDTLQEKPLPPMVDITGQSMSPFFHIRLKSSLGREDKEKILQKVVKECLDKKVVISQARYVVDQELDCPEPSIKIRVTVGLSEKDLKKSAKIVAGALVKVLPKK